MSEIALVPYDKSLDEVFLSRYDVSIFVCGYEERCTYLPSILPRQTLGSVMVLGFSGMDGAAVKKSMDFFSDNLGDVIQGVDYLSGGKIADKLSELLSFSVDDGRRKRVLVDYSSMPKWWISELLNFYKNSQSIADVEFDFVYAIGEHGGQEKVCQLGDPVVLPGCESISTSGKSTLAIFSLGFDSGAPLCIHGKIEPDKTFVMIARPGALDGYTKKAYSINEDFISSHVDGIAYSPLSSVRQAYDNFVEMSFPHRKTATTVLVPFGPKPHSLAAILAAMNSSVISCLYASTGSSYESVSPTSQVVVTRVMKEVAQT